MNEQKKNQICDWCESECNISHENEFDIDDPFFSMIEDNFTSNL